MLCQISRIRHLFTKPVLLTILNSLTFSTLFYCSTVWAGTSKQNLQKLQLVQNFAARLLTDTKKFDHISPVLRELGWPSIKDQLLVRDTTQVYKIVIGLRPLYLSSKLSKRSDTHHYNTRKRDNLRVCSLRWIQKRILDLRTDFAFLSANPNPDFWSGESFLKKDSLDLKSGESKSRLTD